MERQTKHRILGVLVLAGLVVISLPFFQTRNELPSQKALLNAPPFPDQAAQPAQGDTSAINKPVTTSYVVEPVDTVKPVETTQTTETAEVSEPLPMSVSTEPLVTPVPDKGVVPEPVEAVNLNESTITRIDAPVITPVAEKEAEPAILPPGSVKDTADREEVAESTPKHESVPVKPAAKKVKVAQHIKKSRHRVLDGYQVLDAEDLKKLTSTAWAVQLGSFKNKSNAVKLVNQLRTRGYHSFIEQAQSNKHGLTKVLVGPESEKTKARKLASRLESEVHMRGIVVNYKPLVL